MALFDLLGRRWAMGILWNLNEGPCTFRDLQSRCETISPSILNRRLKELREALFIERVPQGYSLTDQGQQLYKLLKPLGKWSKGWATDITNNNDQNTVPPDNSAEITGS